MSLKNKFKTNSAAAGSGVWVIFENAKNADGTVPAFKLARMSKQNKGYMTAMRRITEKYKTASGEFDASRISDEEGEKILLEVFVDNVLLSWRHVQPEDDGKSLEFTKENALKLLADPDWLDLVTELRAIAENAHNFKQAAIEADVKN